jgi:hypothetical protein
MKRSAQGIVTFTGQARQRKVGSGRRLQLNCYDDRSEEMAKAWAQGHAFFRADVTVCDSGQKAGAVAQTRRGGCRGVGAAITSDTWLEPSFSAGRGTTDIMLMRGG